MGFRESFLLSIVLPVAETIQGTCVTRWYKQIVYLGKSNGPIPRTYRKHIWMYSGVLLWGAGCSGPYKRACEADRRRPDGRKHSGEDNERTI